MNMRRVAATVVACALLGSCAQLTSGSSASTGTSTGATSASAAASSPAGTSATAGAAPSSAATTSAKATGVTTTAAATSATTTGTWTLGINGLGPILLGTKYSVLESQGYVSVPTDECASSRTSQKLQDEGVWLYPSGQGANAVLAEIGVTKATYATISGARVGDTMKKLKQLYGSQLKIETKNGNGGPFPVANVRVGTREVVFYFPYASSLGDTAVVQSIIARTWSADLMGEC
ncbi:MAG: hypothetical protein ACOH16_13440 [Propionibacteriaceae bacterium]